MDLDVYHLWYNYLVCVSPSYHNLVVFVGQKPSVIPSVVLMPQKRLCKLCIKKPWCSNKVCYSGVKIGICMNKFWYSMSTMLYLILCFVSLFELHLSSDVISATGICLSCLPHAWSSAILFCHLYLMSAFYGKNY